MKGARRNAGVARGASPFSVERITLKHMDRNLALEVVRVTEAAALASARFVGLGDRNGADHAATEAMRRTFDYLHIRGRSSSARASATRRRCCTSARSWATATPDAPEVDIAVDPLEGTNLCANGVSDALAVVAMAEHGQFLNAPDTYMDKIAVGPIARGAIDIRRAPPRTWPRSPRPSACASTT